MSKKMLAAITLTGMVALALIVGGATFALFTDGADSTENEFTAGTVVLEANRDLGDTIPGPMFYTSESDPTGTYPYDRPGVPHAPPGSEALGGWAPGDVVTRALDLYNRGTLDAKITRMRANVNDLGVTEGAAYEEFIEKMNITVLYPAQNRLLYEGPLSGLLTGDGWFTLETPLIARAGGGALNITFEAHLDLSAGNVVQGETFVFDFEFQAEQLRNNLD